MSANILPTSADIISEIRKCQTVRISTGDIQKHPELFRRMFKNSAEEMLAAIAFQLDGPNGPDLQMRPDGTVLLSRDAENCHFKTFEKADMKITLKIFLSALDVKQVEESVDLAIREANLKAISQLIIAFPSDDRLNIDPSTPVEVQQWLSHILPFWKQLETLVTSHKVHTLGVADLDYEQLKALYESANDIRPMIVHYNIDQCCTVPQELRDYAKEKDIQLLTHNDPHLCILDEKLSTATKKLFGDEKFELQWSARITVWLRSRSIIGAKGYFLQFHRNSS